MRNESSGPTGNRTPTSSMPWRRNTILLWARNEEKVNMLAYSLSTNEGSCGVSHMGPKACLARSSEGSRGVSRGGPKQHIPFGRPKILI